MDIESQRFMALEGVHTWCRAVIEARTKLDDFWSASPDAEFFNTSESRTARMRDFQIERYNFIMSAARLVAYCRWLVSLDFLDTSGVAALETHADTIRDIRNKNEHVIDYFLGEGHGMDTWWNADGSIDASSTFDSMIGGRLDWRIIADIAIELRASLPEHYSPPTEP